MPDRTFYVIGDDNCKFESMTKEQIIAAIVQAVESHTISNVDTGFVQTVKEQNHGEGLKFWVGTTAEYNAISVKDQSTFYVLTDDSALQDFEAVISGFQNELANVNNNVLFAIDIIYKDTSKRSHIFTSEHIASGDVNIPLAKCEFDSLGVHHSYRIDQFSQVKVDVGGNGEFVICTVCNMGSGVTYLLGVGTRNSDGSQVDEVSVHLKCLSDSTHHTLIENNSTLITFEDGVAPVVAPVYVHGIYGIDYRLHY